MRLRTGSYHHGSPIRNWISVLVVSLLLTSALAACGGSGTKTNAGAGPGAATDTIVIKNFSFMPPTDTVKPGVTVTVKNEDSTAHTLTATGSAKGMFDTGNIGAGQTKTFTVPSKPGTYPYLCTIHNYMNGSLKVG